MVYFYNKFPLKIIKSGHTVRFKAFTMTSNWRSNGPTIKGSFGFISNYIVPRPKFTHSVTLPLAHHLSLSRVHVSTSSSIGAAIVSLDWQNK